MEDLSTFSQALLPTLAAATAASGAITTATEWQHIHTSTAKKLLYTLTFPLFMFTYLPIAICAMFTKPEWKPIEHRVSAAQLRKRRVQELIPM